MTFGLLYDIVDAACCPGVPMPVDYAHFDFTFQDARPDVTLLPPRQVQPNPPTPFHHMISEENYENFNRYGRRESLRDMLPHKKIGGVGRVLVFLIGPRRNVREEGFKDMFALGNTTMETLKWDEEIEYGMDRNF